MSEAVAWAFISTLIVVFFLPTIVALRRRHPDWPIILLHNLILGPFVIGWVFAMIKAVSPFDGQDPLASDSPAARPCPNCGTLFDPIDYRPTAPEWRCSRCGDLLPRS